MASTRFRSDPGLTARMGLVMLLVGGLYVTVMAVLIAGGASFISVVFIAVALGLGQWYFSDKLAMTAMRAREVTPEEAPELHAMVDRLCAMADMTKPRVAIADIDVPERLRHRTQPEPLRRLRDDRHPAPSRPRGARGRRRPTSCPTSRTATCS